VAGHGPDVRACVGQCALELGGQARSSGRSAAVIDLDIVYDMLDHRPKSDAAVWLLARQTAAILADHFFRSGVELVVVEGSFCDIDERAECLARLTTPITPARRDAAGVGCAGASSS
jgi:hypothetical protein